MSKYIKYISSSHYGAPQLLGDRYGYCVEMLRKCLVQGFNERTDLVKAEILDTNKVKFTFTTAHNYVAYQTIKVSDTSYPELNGDALITSATSLSVVCDVYTDVSGMVGNIIDNMSAKAIVSPLGFVEKFADSTRSVFTTDEDEAYFYIDDTKPDNWIDTGTYTYLTAPLVFMTDKMTDLNTVTGKRIFPYDVSNPTHFNTRSFTEGTNIPRNGILNFITFSQGNSSGNTVAQRAVAMEYMIIGNGRMFYFMPTLTYAGSTYTAFNGFGKFKTNNKDKFKLPYLLFANNSRMTTASVGAYHYYRINYFNRPIPSISVSTGSYQLETGIGKAHTAILSGDNDVVNNAIFTPNKGTINPSNTSIYQVSGFDAMGYNQYPDKYNKKLNISKIYVNNTLGNVGYLGGVKWIYNASTLLFKHNTGYTFRYKDKLKHHIIFNSPNMSSYNTDAGNTSQQIYLISLDYKDWGNYE